MKAIACKQDALHSFYVETFGADRRETPRSPMVIIPFNGGGQLTDEELLNKARAAKGNGFLFADLWDGGWQDYPDRYKSQSEADSALCMILAFWTRDPEQIDRLFRQSALYRP